ncbi:uncharacterized protein N7482_010050 [Penicillium canariense]|uniref:Uncharacterized protein n=1 Tax=Penicillium canariense TaxID=189055 RepID=A0A9W9HQP1_9EURO|nr:uncharacterized protein N7482_010050 [Penicillium canariense]KAJ5153572.1 hypothetical protein N7482_010050 [Penicillium canariense]
MAGRAETRTPKPPDRDEYEDLPLRLLRPKQSEDPNASKLIRELVKLRKEIRLRDNLYKREL